MKTLLTQIALILSSLLLVACYPGPESPRGFSLPDGDPEAGKQVLFNYHCLACHSIEGLEDPFVTDELPVSIQIGGDVSHTKTYADLLTSIINPSHRIAAGYELDAITDDGLSKMTNYNDLMTITELIDLVSFLQPLYRLVEYSPTTYVPYH